MTNNNEQYQTKDVECNAKEFYKVYREIKFPKNKSNQNKQSFFDSCISLLNIDFTNIKLPNTNTNQQQIQIENDLNKSIEDLLYERQSNKSKSKGNTISLQKTANFPEFLGNNNKSISNNSYNEGNLHLYLNSISKDNETNKYDIDNIDNNVISTSNININNTNLMTTSQYNNIFPPTPIGEQNVYNNSKLNKSQCNTIKKHSPIKTTPKQISLNTSMQQHNKSNISCKIKATDFLNRSIQYEKKRQAYLENLRNTSLEKDILQMRDNPRLSYNTYAIVKNIKRKPLYENKPNDSKAKLNERFRELYNKEMKENNIPKTNKLKIKGSRSPKKLHKQNDVFLHKDFFSNQMQWMELKNKKIKNIAQDIKTSSEQNQCDTKYGVPKVNSISTALDKARLDRTSTSYRNKPRYEQLYEDYVIKKAQEKKKDNKKRNTKLMKRPLSMINIYGKQSEKIKGNLNKTNIHSRADLFNKKNNFEGESLISKSKERSQDKNLSLNKKSKNKSWEELITNPNFNKRKNEYDKGEELYKINIYQEAAWHNNSVNKIIMKNNDRGLVYDFLG